MNERSILWKISEIGRPNSNSPRDSGSPRPKPFMEFVGKDGRRAGMASLLWIVDCRWRVAYLGCNRAGCSWQTPSSLGAACAENLVERDLQFFF